MADSISGLKTAFKDFKSEFAIPGVVGEDYEYKTLSEFLKMTYVF